MSTILPLLLGLFPQASPPSFPPEARNLRAIYRKRENRGLLTLDGGSLTLSEPRIGGTSRVVVYGARHGKRVIALNQSRPSEFGHLQLGALVVTTGHEGLMGDLNGDGDGVDLCSIVHDVSNGETLSPRAILTPSWTARANPVIGRDLVGITLSEAGEQTHLNGDGDLTDFVGGAWQPSSSTLHLPGLASVGIHAFDGALVLETYESSQNRDYTGDGDQGDGVYFVYDLATQTLTNTRVAIDWGSLYVFQSSGGRTFAFVVSEAGTGRDLDGDGVDSDLLHAYSLDRGVLENLGATGPTYPHVVIDRWVAFGLRESVAGDLNGDGDALDMVLHLYDGASGSIQNLALALGSTDGYGSLFSLLENTELGFAVEEAYQGADLNGDGDQSDRVVHVRDLATGTMLNTGLIGNASGEILLASEPVNGDLNGDGDLNDGVPHLLGAGASPGVTLGVAALDVRLSATWAALLVPETQEGRDLNGDGDQTDYYVLHAYERTTGTLTNLGLTVSRSFAISGRFALVSIDEAGGADWNGDGDSTDRVLHRVDLEHRTLVNLELATDEGDPVLMTSDLWAFVVSENQQGADLDGNGVIEDVGVVHVLDRHHKLHRR